MQFLKKQKKQKNAINYSIKQLELWILKTARLPIII